MLASRGAAEGRIYSATTFWLASERLLRALGCHAPELPKCPGLRQADSSNKRRILDVRFPDRLVIGGLLAKLRP